MSESRERILRADSELFLGSSIHVVGIAEICSRADVNKGTFYHYFPSKIALLLELIERSTRELVLLYSNIARGTQPPAAKMRAIFKIPEMRNAAWKDIHGSTSGCFISNTILELAATEPAIRDKTRWAVDQLIAGLEPIVADILLGEGDTGADVRRKAEAVFGLMQGAQIFAKVRNDPSLFAEYGERSIELVKNSPVSSDKRASPALKG